MGKVPPPAPCKIESIQQGKGVYQLVKARNSPRFGSVDAKTGAVFDFVASERRPERQKLQNTLDFAHRYPGDLRLRCLLALHHRERRSFGADQIIGQTNLSPMNESS